MILPEIEANQQDDKKCPNLVLVKAHGAIMVPDMEIEEEKRPSVRGDV